MAAHDDELTASLIAGLRRGEPGAIYGLWDRYFPKILKQARTQLASYPRRSFDEEDVALSVFDTLQRGARAAVDHGRQRAGRVEPFAAARLGSRSSGRLIVRGPGGML